LKDLNLAFGYTNLVPLYLPKSKNQFKNRIVQRRSISGSYQTSEVYQDEIYKYTIVFKDLFGLDSSGLQNMMKSSGLPEEDSEAKELLDSYKSCMDEALKAYPELFVRYAMNDATVLFKIIDSKVESYNSIIRDVFKLNDPDLLYTVKNLPLTVGLLVYSLWEKYFQNSYLKNNPVYQIAFNKLSILDPSNSNYESHRELFIKLSRFQSLEEINNLEEDE
jgi:hypothetical protein